MEISLGNRASIWYRMDPGEPFVAKGKVTMEKMPDKHFLRVFCQKDDDCGGLFILDKTQEDFFNLLVKVSDPPKEIVVYILKGEVPFHFFAVLELCSNSASALYANFKIDRPLPLKFLDADKIVFPNINEIK